MPKIFYYKSVLNNPLLSNTRCKKIAFFFCAYLKHIYNIAPIIFGVNIIL
nr:MAG TPA: Protein of unknown function (DUF1576) [Caudoviricetes sp.]